MRRVCNGSYASDRKENAKKFKKIQIYSCIFSQSVIIYSRSFETAIRVWRSLVSRLTGGQEAAGSSPVTRTNKKTRNRKVSGLFYYFLGQLKSGTSLFLTRFLTSLRFQHAFQLISGFLLGVSDDMGINVQSGTCFLVTQICLNIFDGLSTAK